MKLYILREPEYLLPVDFDENLTHLCLRWHLSPSHFREYAKSERRYKNGYLPDVVETEVKNGDNP